MTARCPWCNRPAHDDDCYAKLLARRLLDDVGPARLPAPRPVARLRGFLRGLPTLARLFWDQLRRLRGQR